MSSAPRGAASPPGHDLDSSWSSSWSGKVDAEIQRELIASRVFDSGPLTIDRFEVDQLAGAGSSAAVYAARDPLLDRRVALKVFGQARAQQVNVADARWIREARALAQLSHRNVVAIHDVGQWRGRPFIAMELVEGTTLARWLAAKPRAVAEIVKAFHQAGCGLAAAHAAGHVHRDFKPANVLVAHDGRVVVSDFGLAVDAADGSTAAAPGAGAPGGAHPVGTPAYVAPEQRAGAPAHPSADVYSFAVCLIEALIGARPAPEATAAWQRALRCRVSRRLFRAACRAMVEDPRHRTQSLAGLLDALAPGPEPGQHRVIRTTLLGGAAMLAVVVVIWSSRRPAESDPPAAAPRLSPSMLPAEIDSEVQALLDTAPARRDRRWDERARTVLMLPIPTKVHCGLGAPLHWTRILGGDVIALDAHDRLASCAVHSGIVTPIADGVLCYQRIDDSTLGAWFRTGDAVVYRHGEAGWRPLSPAQSRAMTAAIDGGRPEHCRAWRDSTNPRDDEVVAAGDRKLTRRRDGSIWAQAGTQPEQRLVEHAIYHQADRDLRHAIVATATRAQVFDLETMRVITEVASPSPEAFPGISPDGSVAALSADGQILWWRRDQPQWQHAPTDTPAGPVSISPNGERVLIAGAGALDVRELRSGRRYTLAGAQIYQAQFLDEDRVVAIDFSGGIWWWSLSRLRSWILADHAGQAWMWGFARCKRGDSLATATNPRGQPIRISSPGGTPPLALPTAPDTQIYGLSCDDDRVLAGTRDGRLLEWDRRTGRKLAEHDTGARAWLWTVAPAETSGQRAAIVGTGSTRDQQIGGRVLLLRDGVVTQAFAARYSGGEFGINEIAVSSNGRWAAAVASSGELALIDVARGIARATAARRGASRRVRFTDHDRTLVTGHDDGYVRVWRADDLSLLGEIDVGHGKIYDLDVHGSLAIVATSDGHVGAWDLATRRLQHTYRPNGPLAATSRFDASGDWIVSGDDAGSACLHQADHDGCYLTLIGHKAVPGVRHAVVLDNGDLATASDDGTVRQWRPPYRASRAELACELGQHHVAHGPGAMQCL